MTKRPVMMITAFWNTFHSRCISLITCLRLFTLIVVLGNSGVVLAQVQQKYPANVTPVLGQPYSVFLSDYSSPGSNALTANILFNDFNEPSWTFKLKIKIESSSVRIQTVEGFRPMQPITLAPGVMKTLTGSDWEEYFNYNNLTISGISLNTLLQTGGKLPEGFYSFCFQVLDYDTGDPLSQEICQTAWIKLLDPPRINLPLCGNSLDPKLTQHAFTWQLFDVQSPNAIQSPQFQLTIWELTERGANIQTAVQNGQALQIFQSQAINGTSYQYSLSDPPFEIGKQYVYRVQVLDPNGKDRYKNQGFSEFCTFYYGWPIGGKIALKSPVEGGGFRKKDMPLVEWKAVDTQLPGQNVSYEIKIAPMSDDQSKEEALRNNTPWYYYNTPPAPFNYDRAQQIEQTLQVMTKYAWQIKAFSDQQEIGKSDISYFNGPSLMENFFAGVHRVAVDYIDGTDLNDISGGGRVRFEPQSEAWTTVKFDHIQLKNQGDFYVMVGGEFFYEPKNFSVELTPDIQSNGKAYFDVNRFRVNKDGIYAEGSVRWQLPFATVSEKAAIVRSEKVFANYNDFAINEAAPLRKDNQFKLVDPFNFILDLYGFFNISNNQLKLDFHGTVEMPEKIKGAVPGKVKFPFVQFEQLYYNEQDSLTNPSIAPMNKSNLELAARRYILDLSETQSPSEFASSPAWKGIYFENFDLIFNPSLDGNGQFDLNEAFVQNFDQTQSTTDAWVTPTGLDLKFDFNFPDSVGMIFQTFPSFVNQCRIEIDDSQVVADKSFLKGSLVVPVVSTESLFGFTVPINNQGFQDGSLENLTGTKFIHNPNSGDQEIFFTIKRAVFSGYQKITMTVDLDWPSLGVKLTDLRGFNAWGDYSIGFDNKNGTIPLSQRYNATLSTYPITIGVIGAGANNGTYIVATTADAGLGDDVSGGEGVPSINVYSVVANKYIPLETSGATVVDATDQISFEQASANVTQDYQQLGENLSQQLEASHEQMLQEAESLKESLAGADGQLYAAEEMVSAGETFPAEAGQGAPVQEDGKFNSRQQELVYEIASGFVEEMARPLTDPIKKKTDSLSAAVEKTVRGFIDDASAKVRDNVEIVVRALAEKIINAVDSKIDISEPVNRMADLTRDRITLEITTSLTEAAEVNIIDPVNVLLKEQVHGRINRHITVNGTNAVYAAITGDGNAKEALDKLISESPTVIDSIIRDVIAFVSVDNIRSTVEGTATAFVKNISVSEIGHDLRRAAEDILKEELNKAAVEAVSNIAEKYAEDIGLGAFDVGGENPINFVGAAERLAKGDIKGVFAIDPVRVKLRTPVIDLDGFMSYTPQHPVYGDVWLGDIDMTIKVPKKFAFNAIYFNGRKDEVSYWFCQITPPNGNNTPYELGKPLAKAAKPLEKPVDIGIAKIVGASGRLYHHMKETSGGGIVPDGTMRYGAYMHFVFFDKGSGGKNLRLEVSGEINSSENGDYTIAFDGNAQIRSNSVQVLEIDKTAVVQGTVMIRYNSAEEHFLGYAKVVVNKPGSLCAQGSLLVDVKPGRWRVAIGTREERIIFVPGCAGWSPTGWLDVNESVAELGLGVQYSGRAKSPNVNLGIVKFNVQVDAGFAFGILAAIQYNPDFALMRAGIWLDLWASIIANYKFPLRSWKSITLVEIYIRGDLIVIFNPPPTTLTGRLDGKCRVLGFSVNFKANFEKQL